MSKFQFIILFKLLVLLFFQDLAFSNSDFCEQMLIALQNSKNSGFTKRIEFSHNRIVQPLKLQEYSHNYQWFTFLKTGTMHNTPAYDFLSSFTETGSIYRLSAINNSKDISLFISPGYNISNTKLNMYQPLDDYSSLYEENPQATIKHIESIAANFKIINKNEIAHDSFGIDLSLATPNTAPSIFVSDKFKYLIHKLVNEINANYNLEVIAEFSKDTYNPRVIRLVIRSKYDDLGILASVLQKSLTSFENSYAYLLEDYQPR